MEQDPNDELAELPDSRPNIDFDEDDAANADEGESPRKSRGRPRLPELWSRVICVDDDLTNMQFNYSIASELQMAEGSRLPVLEPHQIYSNVRASKEGRRPVWSPYFSPK